MEYHSNITSKLQFSRKKYTIKQLIDKNEKVHQLHSGIIKEEERNIFLKVKIIRATIYKPWVT